MPARVEHQRGAKSAASVSICPSVHLSFCLSEAAGVSVHLSVCLSDAGGQSSREETLCTQLTLTPSCMLNVYVHGLRVGGGRR